MTRSLARIAFAAALVTGAAAYPVFSLASQVASPPTEGDMKAQVSTSSASCVASSSSSSDSSASSSSSDSASCVATSSDSSSTDSTSADAPPAPHL